MKITGTNLRLVEEALDLAYDELRNQIAMCTDVQRYADDIEAIKAKQLKIMKLKAKIVKAILKEQDYENQSKRSVRRRAGLDGGEV